MKMRLYLLLGVLLMALSLSGQNYQPGFLVTLEGDTVRGLVAPGASGNYAFKEDRNSSRRFYHEDELSAIDMGEGTFEKHLVEVVMGKFPEKRVVFLQVVVDGPLRLLEYQGEGLLFGNPYTNHFLYHDESEHPWRVPTGERMFRTQMSRYCADATELASSIKSGELGYDNLPEIVRNYNGWLLSQPLEETGEEESAD